jgi:hypothetical protein
MLAYHVTYVVYLLIIPADNLPMITLLEKLANYTTIDFKEREKNGLEV